jgi:hypothetical protein
MPISQLEYLRHILDETVYLVSEKKELSKDQFLRDATIIERTNFDYYKAGKFSISGKTMSGNPSPLAD